MKIGIDISQIAHKGTGVARFTNGFIESILKHNSENEWTFFYSSFRAKIDQSLKQKIENSQHKLHTFPFPPSLLSFVFNDLHKYSKLVTCNLKLFTDLDWFITSDWIEFPLPIKKATIIHDLVVEKHPETVHPRIIRTHKKRLKYASRESKILFADSQATSNDLQEKYGIEKKRIIINYPGVEISPAQSKANQKAYLIKHGITEPYILTVGKREPRKNLQRLIKAFQNLKPHGKSPQLIIVGPEGWGKIDEVQNNNIRFLGYVSDEVLSTLYTNACCFVYPSIYEGFGFPIIEAMKYGCPVATSNVSSLPEIAGKAALFFDPFDVSSIQNAIEQLLQIPKLRFDLVTKGFDQSKKYTWDRYYNTLINAFEKYSS
ncbi:MAG: Glycosyl transferase group 1 [Candidatus Roizmanbacteria bacterium GW2011_GWA2_37_7]|uniref:Glycosyl transferase group 1 n=1 Tax=Candidatus Roizmanbacteria bacterium GW2011_GWA2_37_7 TaxID=1618481 RepID=A0A0G0KDY2_9BACT|nr:MAG: Glycosyl transferase group 1 [Candidatus Roizmanbacteria bacterium GW2011_GWA2_37_7]